MIGTFIKYVLIDYCLHKIEQIITMNMDISTLSDVYFDEEWSIDIGVKFKTIVTIINGEDNIYHNCKIIDNEYKGSGWRIMISYDNFNESKKYMWISYYEIYKMIR